LRRQVIEADRPRLQGRVQIVQALCQAAEENPLQIGDCRVAVAEPVQGGGKPGGTGPQGRRRIVQARAQIA